MSDSEGADLPSAAAISRSLRQVVNAIYNEGNPEELTVKRVRLRTEQDLSLPAGYLKGAEWKQKSDQIIRDAVDQANDEDSKPSPSPKKPTKQKPAAKPAPTPKKSKVAADSPRGVKRKAAAPVKKVTKRKKPAVSSDEEPDAVLSDSPVSDAESEPPKKPARRSKKVVAEESDEEESATKTTNKAISDEDEDVDDAPTATPKKPAQAAGDVSESEMSSLIDESPAKKKRQKKAPEKKGSKAKTAKAAKPQTKSGKDEDPDTAEIKRLQGWLVKCGIRKVWSKELAKCDSDKEKIKHLKAMLKDAGMEGKFSVEKAAKIKEQREFAKDLEAITEQEKSWGHVEEGAGGRPRRRAAQAAKPVVVQQPIDSDEDEEMQDAEDSEDDSDHQADSVKGDSDGSGSDSESDAGAGDDSD